jgi:hypothetical protein
MGGSYHFKISILNNTVISKKKKSCVFVMITCNVLMTSHAQSQQTQWLISLYNNQKQIRGSSRIYLCVLDLPHVSASHCRHQGVVVTSEVTEEIRIVDVYAQGRALPKGQPGQSEQLADPPPQYIKIWRKKIRSFVILWQQRVYIAHLDVWGGNKQYLQQ